MKTLRILLFILLPVLCCYSCKKDSGKNKDSFELEYRVSDIGNAFQITYADSTGTAIQTQKVASDFPGGVRKIRVAGKPFAATLNVIMGNPTYAARPYTIAIYIDGVQQAKNDFSIVPQSMSTQTVQYTVE